jgi:hypothetical protein
MPLPVLPSPVPGNWSGSPFSEYRFPVHKRTKFNGFALEYIGKLLDYVRQNKKREAAPAENNYPNVNQGGI